MNSTRLGMPGNVIQQCLTPLILGMALLTISAAAAELPPAAPANPSTTTITSTSIAWSWQDQSADETNFKVWTDPGAVTPSTLSTITPANTSSWTQTGLAVNALYSFQVAAVNVYGTSARTTPLSAWTLAAVPVKPVIETAPAFEIAVGANDGNPAQTVYAIQCITLGQWLQAGGSLGASPLFQTAAAWGSIDVIGFMSGTTYSFGVCAQNGAGTTTALGPEASGSTDALVTVPDLAGLPLVGAKQALKSATLVLGSVSIGYSATQPSGRIFAQNPPSGAEVTVNTPINVVISQGPAPVTVPSVVGLPRAPAESAIVAATLTVGGVTESFSSTVASGRVVSQDPAAGTQLQRGLPVDLVISLGPAPTTALSLQYTGPNPIDAAHGSCVTITVVPQNAHGTVNYQWYRNDGGTPLEILGQTDATLLAASVCAADAGQYYCEGSDTASTAISEMITLNVGDPVPALGGLGLAALVSLTALVGAATLRRRNKQSF